MKLNLLKDNKLLNSILTKYVIRLIGLRKITMKFWYRWIASGADYSDIVNTIGKIKDFGSWCSIWSVLASKYEGYAKEAEKQYGFLSTQEFYLKANVYYYLAQWAVFENNEEKRNAYKKSKECFLSASKYFEVPAREVSFSYKKYKIPGYLRIPQKSEKVPCVIFIHGMDSAKEEVFWTEKEAVDRKIASFVFDGPGQGELFILENIVWEEKFDEVIFRAIDYIEQIPEIDKEKIYIVGLSWGGFWALKVSALDKRIKACISIGGPPTSESFYKLPIPIRIRFEKLFNYDGKNPELGKRLLKEMELGDLAHKIKCPTLLVHGKKDPLVPFDSVSNMYEQLTCEKDFKMYEDGDHCCTQHAREVRNLAADWLLSKIKSESYGNN